MHGVFSGSAAADGDDDFELVARGELRGRVLAFRDNFAVPFNGNALAGVTELIDQAADGECFWEMTIFAINFDF